MAEQPEEPVLPASVDEALASAPAFYANSFMNLQGMSDITTIFQRNGRDELVLNMSFTTAKTYSLLLGQIIASVEEYTGQEIMTTQRIVEAHAKAAGLGATTQVGEA